MSDLVVLGQRAAGLVATVALAVGLALFRQFLLGSGTHLHLDSRSDAVTVLYAQDDQLVGASLETLASGFGWAEGPLFLSQSGSLLFSDVEGNKVLRWSSGDGVEVVREPSGAARDEVPELPLIEPGSNGLTLSPDGKFLVVCDHGSRRVYAVPLSNLDSMSVVVLADSFEGGRLNSPNDLAFDPVTGDLYFTDPSYGLKREGSDWGSPEKSPYREQPFNRVYRIPADVVSQRLSDSSFVVDRLAPFSPLAPVETEPVVFGVKANGIGFSRADTDVLYIGVSGATPRWLKLNRRSDGTFSAQEPGDTFVTATPLKDPTFLGGADGFATDVDGSLWATGPGGVWHIASDGSLLSHIATNRKTGNCALGEDYLYITADDTVFRIQVHNLGDADK